MFVSLARRSLAACAFAALALPVCAATPPPYYSPVAAGIDKVCSPVARGAASKPAVRLARLDGADGTLGPWLHSNADLEERSIDSPSFHGGDFVIVNEAPALFTASETHRDAATSLTSPKTTAWCFEGGKLSRATFELILPDQQLEFRHTQYFDSDLDEPTADLLQSTSIDAKHKGPVPQPSPSSIAIQRYNTPSDLPFYDAYEAALDRKLPMLATPAP
jgi:hypothetical protein